MGLPSRPRIDPLHWPSGDTTDLARTLGCSLDSTPEELATAERDLAVPQSHAAAARSLGCCLYSTPDELRAAARTTLGGVSSEHLGVFTI